MATNNGNENQTQDNQVSRQTNNGSVNLNSPYKVYGTNEPYSGRVVTIGGFQYTTVGGALEGDSLQLIASTGKTSNNQQQNNSNPVTRTFVSRVTYYTKNGTAVPPGTDLHQHQDGTVMLGHDVNNMGEIVTRNRTNQRVLSATSPSRNNGNQNTTPGGPRNNNNQMNQGGSSY